MALPRIEQSNHLSFLDIRQSYFFAGCNTITDWGYGRSSLVNRVLSDLVCSSNFVLKRRRFTPAVFGFLLCCAQGCFYIPSGKINSNKSSAKWGTSSTKRVKRRQPGQVRCATTAYGHFNPRTKKQRVISLLRWRKERAYQTNFWFGAKQLHILATNSKWPLNETTGYRYNRAYMHYFAKRNEMKWKDRSYIFFVRNISFTQN